MCVAFCVAFSCGFAPSRFHSQLVGKSCHHAGVWHCSYDFYGVCGFASCHQSRAPAYFQDMGLLASRSHSVVCGLRLWCRPWTCTQQLDVCLNDFVEPWVCSPHIGSNSCQHIACCLVFFRFEFWVEGAPCRGSACIP